MLIWLGVDTGWPLYTGKGMNEKSLTLFPPLWIIKSEFEECSGEKQEDADIRRG